ncbi:dTMP kinase [Texas Phoenix palm phytoplasma]|uniref:Thymidylate kinase n=1 Tax=Texas Phoenix palm phytoplasma TaxID=176709 RepID=A0ABS5BIZ3_9MOLU|nr:dTMP kinase [Texas Phoenix palm phytoplasma]MBP3059551.1 dTMP kinase [Texas Phoenix palm phytoplasma]
MFISFEGGESTGKTTLSKFLFKKLSNNYEVILTKEPGDGIFNSKIKNILFNFSNKIDIITESLLYAADRNEHLRTVIIPSLENKKIVVCDRYLDSSIVYQGFVGGAEEKWLKKINYKAFLNLPNITFYLDLDPKIALERLYKNRKDKIEYFDLKDLQFHNRIRQGYLNLCEISLSYSIM